MLQFIRLENSWPPICVTTERPFSYLLIMFFKVEDPSKEFQNSKSCLIGTNIITNLLKVLPTFYKHVIIINLDNLGWILKLDAKFSLLDRWIACVVTKPNLDASSCYKWKQSKINTQYTTNNTKNMNAKKKEYK